MRGIRVMGAALGLLASVGATGSAQEARDEAAWLAMMFTPYGALPPVVTPAMAGIPLVEGRPGSAFEIRYGRWRFDVGDEYLHTVGVGGRAGALGFVLGYETCDGCEGAVMGGIDFEVMLRASPIGAPSGTSAPNPQFSLGLRTAFGLGVGTGSDSFNAISGTLDLPIAVSIPIGTGGHLVPFLSPGGGVARLSAEGDAEIGVRASLGAGVGLVMAGGFGAHLGWRRIFLEDAPSSLGLGISFAR